MATDLATILGFLNDFPGCPFARPAGVFLKRFTVCPVIRNFSPITTGLDFSISEKQDVFIYIKGNTISPSASFQQATRTRNINKLYYYSCCKEKKYIYNSIEDVKRIYTERIETNDKLLNISGCIDENDELKIIDNTFLNLFCYGVY